MMAIVMGVCGVGKTTVGRALATELGCSFFDADDFHPQSNVTKMASGIALTDDDRWPWLDRLAAEMHALRDRGQDGVLACSALRQAYRDRLSRDGDVQFIYLKADASTIEPRLAARTGHCMPPALLASQFATLEEPQDAIVIDAAQPVGAQVAAIVEKLKSST